MYDFSKKAKKVTIPETLFVDMCKYLYSDEPTVEQRKKIGKGIQQYLDNKVDRELYSMSIVAPTEEQREKARQEYLERKGIPKDFRW